MAKTAKPSAPAANDAALSQDTQSPQDINALVYEELETAKQNCLAILNGTRFSLKQGIINVSLSRLQHRFRSPATHREGSARRVFGPITPGPVAEKDQKGATAIASDELRHEVDGIYPGFAERETDDLIGSLEELQIRGVAKRAGLQVTETKPERITTAFIEEIKQAIRAKEQNRKLVSDPAGVAKEAREKIEAEIDDITVKRTAVEKALEDKTLDADKIKALRDQVALLTEQEGELYGKLDDLPANV